MIEHARQKLVQYKLQNVNLIVQQGLGQENIDVNELKSMLMQDLYKDSEEVLRIQAIQIDSLKRNLELYKTYDKLTLELLPEINVLFPSIEEASCSHTYIMHTGNQHSDTVMLVYLKSKEVMANEEQKNYRNGLRQEPT
ncbi:MAG: hypothetical protein LIP01_04210 [Tannerellaceae bacterium]|nr:hypothetical protein [Tannerellaceae bacterium]